MTRGESHLCSLGKFKVSDYKKEPDGTGAVSLLRGGFKTFSGVAPESGSSHSLPMARKRCSLLLLLPRRTPVFKEHRDRAVTPTLSEASVAIQMWITEVGYPRTNLMQNPQKLKCSEAENRKGHLLGAPLTFARDSAAENPRQRSCVSARRPWARGRFCVSRVVVRAPRPPLTAGRQRISGEQSQTHS